MLANSVNGESTKIWTAIEKILIFSNCLLPIFINSLCTLVVVVAGRPA